MIEHIQWNEATKTRLNELRDKMLPFAVIMKLPRNKFTAHNDLNTILQRSILGVFDKPDDTDYFDTLQEFTSVALGDRFLFGDLVRNDVEFFMTAFDRGRIKRF